jgi:hypothetical protein
MSPSLNGTTESVQDQSTVQDATTIIERRPRRTTDCKTGIKFGGGLWAPGGTIPPHLCPKIDLYEDNENEIIDDDETNKATTGSHDDDTLDQMSLTHPEDWARSSTYFPPPVTVDIHDRPHAPIDLSHWGPESMDPHEPKSPSEDHPQTHVQSESSIRKSSPQPV